jgi:adenylate cyclase
MKKTNKMILAFEISLLLIMWALCPMALFNGEGLLQGFEGKWSDKMFFFKVEKPSDKRIFIAAIDEKTTEALGYPLKRRYYASMIDSLGKLGVKVIGFDVMFFNPYKDNPIDDRRLIAATKKNKNVINLFAVAKGATGDYEVLPPFSSKLSAYSRYIAYPNVDLALDEDGHVRRYKVFRDDMIYSDDPMLEGKECLGGKCNGIPMPSLAAATYATYKDIPIDRFYVESSIPFEEAQFLNFKRPVDWGTDKEIDGHIYRYISILDIIRNKLTKEEREIIKGGIALVGSTTLGAYDHTPSPFSKRLPGVEIHATVIDNLLHNDFLKPGNAALLALILVIFIFGPYFLRRYSALTIFIPVLAATIFLYYLNIYLFHKDIRFLFVGPFIGLWLSFLTIIIHKAFTEGKEKAWIKNTFGQYLSPKIVKVITDDPSKLKLGGDKRDMTVFFLDIAHFTTISEKLSPEELTTMLNKYLSGFTDIILKYDGVVDKYIGDCIMAFWNAPLDQEKHRALTCFAAIDCMAELDRLNGAAIEGEEQPDIRIGVNSGPAVVGNMGSNTRLSYTVLGDTVNLASRLESANKFFGSKIMVSEFTYDEAKDDVEARFLGKIRVVGKSLPIKVYELLSKKGELSADMSKLVEEYNKGLDLFYKFDYKKAQAQFEKVVKMDASDGPSNYYKNLAKEYIANPPENWDGVITLTGK